MTAIPKISRPANSALATIGITTLEHLATHGRKELLALHGVGPKAIRILEPVLAAHGLDFAPDPHGKDGN